MLYIIWGLSFLLASFFAIISALRLETRDDNIKLNK